MYSMYNKISFHAHYTNKKCQYVLYVSGNESMYVVERDEGKSQLDNNELHLGE
jgi:hypothetical protein